MKKNSILLDLILYYHKLFKRITSFLIILSTIISFSSCTEDEDEDNTDDTNTTNSSGLSGTVWQGSEDTTTYLKFTSSSVIKCFNGKEVATGTFDSKAITFIVPANGEKFIFPLSVYSDYIVVGVPKGFENTHDPETYYPSSKYPCDGNSSGGGGSGGGESGSGGSGGGESGNLNGNITLWTASDHSCGNILVKISNGQSGVISSYYSSGLNDCNASGCANFTLPSGSYNYTATCSDYTWSGSFTIKSGTCHLWKLN